MPRLTLLPSFLALVTRIRHQRGFLNSAVLQTQRALESLPRGIAWEGTTNSLSRVFEREITERALAVPSIDNYKEQDQERSTEEASTRSPVTRVRGLGMVRSASYGPGGVTSGHARMGSLASPLAKMFSVDGGQLGAAGKVDGVKQKEKEAEKGGSAKALETRLDAIEAAVSSLWRPTFICAADGSSVALQLAILVGEVVKSSEGADSEKRPPLTSLTGQIEQLYKDDD